MSILNYIKESISKQLEEENVSSNVAPIATPFAFKSPKKVDEVTGAVKTGGGRRYIPELLPPIPEELRGEHFKIVKGNDGELKLYVSPYVKLGLEGLERGRSTFEKEFKEKTSLTRYISEKMSPQTRGAIKKGLDGSKLVNFGGKQMILCNVELQKEDDGQYYVKNPYLNGKDVSAPSSKKYGLSDEEYNKFFEGKIQAELNESYGSFKNEVKNRTKNEQLHKAIKHVKKRLKEVDRIVEYTHRMKLELSEGEDGLRYLKTTEKNLAEMQEMVSNLNEKIKTLNA